jgi:hypothetical protein
VKQKIKKDEKRGLKTMKKIGKIIKAKGLEFLPTLCTY